MKVLLVSSSARGHAIADALHRSPQKPEIISICVNRNPGIRKIAARSFVQNIMDFPAIVEIAKQEKPNFAFIGPDDPIGAGLADVLQGIGIPSVAPKKKLAQVETSKGFTRELLQKYKIDASPKFRVFSMDQNSNGALTELKKDLYTFIDQDLNGEYVVKYDALKGGKGVIEEKLIGVEFSLLSFVSGPQVVDMPAVQDRKRAYDGDTGPNTGGMGT